MTSSIKTSINFTYSELVDNPFFNMKYLGNYPKILHGFGKRKTKQSNNDNKQKTQKNASKPTTKI